MWFMKAVISLKKNQMVENGKTVNKADKPSHTVKHYILNPYYNCNKT